MARPGGAQPLSLLDVPFISQSEALCGGAAAAMVLRYWGAQGLTAESFAPLVDRSAAGIRTDTLVADLVGRGYAARGIAGDAAIVGAELARGRPVVALIEDRPGTFHYVVIVGWHDRGVVLHDPARAPFQVLSREEFDRRWQAAARWLLVVTPPADAPVLERSAGAALEPAATACDQQIAAGVRAAQGDRLEEAERLLTAAVSCPGGAAYRELAAVRLLQRRWDDVRALSAAALAEDATDAYAWRLLGTARFVEGDPAGALAAWNRVAEPTVDLVRVDGLVRTRQRVVEEFLGFRIGSVLGADDFRRAQRAADELPAAAAAGVSYVPTGQARAEVRINLAERALLPRGPLALGLFGARVAATRELDLGVSSLTGGGERLSGSWRFWPGRPRYAVTLAVPGPGRGLWEAAAVAERQPFNDGGPDSERVSGELGFSRWESSNLRWSVAAGAYRWKRFGRYGSAAATLRYVSHGDRLLLQGGSQAWLGPRRFATWQGTGTFRTSTAQDGPAGIGRLGVAGVSARTLAALWAAADTGHARPLLLRAHPVLDDGALRVERLGRLVVTASLEGQWWFRRGLLRVAPAAFLDMARTGRRLAGPALHDADVGAGIRLGVAGTRGIVRIDVARGLRDGHSALSLVYEP